MSYLKFIFDQKNFKKNLKKNLDLVWTMKSFMIYFFPKRTKRVIRHFFCSSQCTAPAVEGEGLTGSPNRRRITAHNALKSTVNRKGQKRRIWLLPTQTLSYGEPKFIVILLPCHTTMLKSHIMKYFTFEINLLGEKWKFCNFSFRPPRNALKVLK